LLASGDRGASRLSLYNGTAALRLCRGLHRVAVVAAVAGSLAQPAVLPTQPVQVADASPPIEQDLAYARAAATDILAHGGSKDASVPWRNPQTGAGGNITPLATSYKEGAQSCRDFLTSYVHGEAQDWLQGAACRTSSGTWEVKRLKALKPS
jgi:surface antigen